MPGFGGIVDVPERPLAVRVEPAGRNHAGHVRAADPSETTRLSVLPGGMAKPPAALAVVVIWLAFKRWSGAGTARMRW